MIAWQLANRRVLVVGGGQVARQRVGLALQAGAHVIVVAPTLTEDLQACVDAQQVVWRARTFAEHDADDMHMILCATDDADVSDRVFAAARAARIPINVADVPERCDFWFAATERVGPVQIAVSTNGHAPAIGARLKGDIVARLSPFLERAVRRFQDVRTAVRRRDPDPAASRRRMHWLRTLALTWSYREISALRQDDIDGLVDHYRASIHASSPPPHPSATPHPHVDIVGAGPGAADLLTVRAQDAIAGADVVVCDQLVPTPIRALVTGQLLVAKRRGGPAGAQFSQAEVEQWVIDACRAGRRVVRLKIGDPLLFGRAQEEVARYESEGLRVTLTPGVCSFSAAGSDAFVSLTQRHLADRVLILTGRGADGRAPRAPNYDTDTTVVVLMGVARAAAIAQAFVDTGWPPSTPVAIIERASTPTSRCTRCRLDSLALAITERQVVAPAVIIIGAVAVGVRGPHATAERKSTLPLGHDPRPTAHVAAPVSGRTAAASASMDATSAVSLD